MPRSIRLLFAGHAPVHYLCFRPIAERLAAWPDLEIWYSGGRKIVRGGWVDHDAPALYVPFGVPRERVLSLEEMRHRSFDMVFCAHSGGFFPDVRPRAVQIFHGVSFRNCAIQEAQLQYDQYFVIGPYMRRVLARRRILAARDPRALPIGFPKLDRLVDGSLDRAATLRSLGLDGRRPVLLFAPTGDRGNALEVMGEEVIRALRDEDRWDLVIKPHDHPKQPAEWLQWLAPLEGPHVRLASDPDIVPLLHAADLLITDASSAAYEYCLLDRPILFLDVPRLIARARRKGRAVDLATHGRKVGTTVRRASEVPAAVRASLRDPERGSPARRRAAADLFYGPGGATERAAQWIRAVADGNAASTLREQARCRP